MRTFETAQDVLTNAQAFHYAASQFYRGLHRDSADERAKMLLLFLYEHEDKMSASLASYQQHASEGVLNTWMQYTLEQSPEHFIEQLDTPEHMSVEQIGALGQTIDSYLLEVFEELMQTAATDDLRELFQNLMAMEIEEKHALTRATNGVLRDM